jgi:hypothetical protein
MVTRRKIYSMIWCVVPLLEIKPLLDHRSSGGDKPWGSIKDDGSAVSAA